MISERGTRRSSKNASLTGRVCRQVFMMCGAVLMAAITGKTSGPTFYKDVLPILQSHCQGCHRAGEMAPMPLETYRQVKPFARAIAEVTATKVMPPWFADPCCGHFSNDPSLTADQITTLRAWADANAPAG